MIQKQGDDGDRNSMDKYSGKVAPAHVLMHARTWTSGYTVVKLKIFLFICMHT